MWVSLLAAYSCPCLTHASALRIWQLYFDLTAAAAAQTRTQFEHSHAVSTCTPASQVKELVLELFATISIQVLLQNTILPTWSCIG